MILAVDPGRDKVGVVLYSFKTGIVGQEIIPFNELSSYLARLGSKYRVEKVLIGDGTCSKDLASLLAKEGWEYTFVDERNSSEEARALFFKENPPRGWRRLIPPGLLTPPRPIDDFAARIILKRFLNK